MRRFILAALLALAPVAASAQSRVECAAVLPDGVAPV